LFAGTGVGTWLSFTLRQPTLKFLDLVALEEDQLDPGVRVVFVMLLAEVMGLLFWTGAVTIAIGSTSIDTALFKDSDMWVLLIGVLLGIGERTMSSTVFKTATDFVRATGSK
jgi:hypothetical protein